MKNRNIVMITTSSSDCSIVVTCPMLKKIVVIGPESTGKSTLCEELAQHFDSMWCPEFAREYLLTNGTDYDYEDLLTIARGQLALEDEYANMIHHTKPLFIDTDMYVM